MNTYRVLPTPPPLKGSNRLRSSNETSRLSPSSFPFSSTTPPQSQNRPTLQPSSPPTLITKSPHPIPLFPYTLSLTHFPITPTPPPKTHKPQFPPLPTAEAEPILHTVIDRRHKGPAAIPCVRVPSHAIPSRAVRACRRTLLRNEVRRK